MQSREIDTFDDGSTDQQVLLPRERLDKIVVKPITLIYSFFSRELCNKKKIKNYQQQGTVIS